MGKKRRAIASPQKFKARNRAMLGTQPETPETPEPIVEPEPPIPEPVVEAVVEPEPEPIVEEAPVLTAEAPTTSAKKVPLGATPRKARTSRPKAKKATSTRRTRTKKTKSTEAE